MASIKGTNKGELLRGTAAADKVQAMGGGDVIVASGGNDTIDGGLGTDTLDYSGLSGPIRVSPLVPSNEPTWTVGKYDGAGALTGTDQFTSVENIIGTSGNDLITLGADNNDIYGGAGDDRLVSGGGNDRVYGGAGDDLLDGGPGNDLIDGGDGIDTLFWDGGAPLYLTVDLQAGTVTYAGDPGIDTLVSIENVRGNYGNKQIFGTDGANIVQGSTGSDLIDGRGGDDVLVGDYGRWIDGVNGATLGYDDTIRGGAGNDVLSGDLGTDILTGGSGADTFVVDSYYGSDRITDFEDGIDTLALYGGLTISGWEARDTNGDGTADSAAALLSNGQAVIFDGYTSAPGTLASGSGLALHAEQFAIPELTNWSAADGWGGMGL